MTKTDNGFPMPVKGSPFAHQKKAFEYTLCRFGQGPLHYFRSDGVALLMEMGTGKTLVGIAVAGYMGMQYGGNAVKRVLVVCPLSITGVWESEFSRFADFPYKLKILDGPSEKRKRTLLELSEDLEPGIKVAVVNYESAWRLEEELMAYNADLVIADEAHRIKEARTRQSKALHHLGDKASYRILMTGTVINNREIDVYSQYRFLNPRIFGTSYYRFRNTYFDMSGYGNHTPVFRKTMTDDFLNRLHSVAFRVRKSECLDLPEVTEETRTVELEPKAMRIYREMEKESFTQLNDSEVSAVNVLTRLLRLSQITGGFITDDDRRMTCVSKAKLDALEDILDEAVGSGQKIVVMARFVPELDAIQDLLRKKDIGFSVIRGGITDRDEQITAFQNDPGVQVFLGQIAAAGLGITLTAASTMVFFSMDYSMANFEQAKARIHRAGQTENCHYIYLAAKGTVDRKVIRALRGKIDLAKALIDDWRAGRNPFAE